jgi:hypothetical protein
MYEQLEVFTLASKRNSKTSYAALYIYLEIHRICFAVEFARGILRRHIHDFTASQIWHGSFWFCDAETVPEGKMGVGEHQMRKQHPWGQP